MSMCCGSVQFDYIHIVVISPLQFEIKLKALVKGAWETKDFDDSGDEVKKAMSRFEWLWLSSSQLSALLDCCGEVG